MDCPERLLPDREIAYNYTAAMFFAQNLEVNLKAILHTIDYSFEDLEDALHPSETKRYKTFETFLHKATTGALKTKLLQVDFNLSEQAWDLLNDACQTRNQLAHRYLQELRLPAPNEEHRDAIIKDVQHRAILLYKAMMITDIARKKLEKVSETQHLYINEFLSECGVEQNKINKGLWENIDE